MTKYSEVKVKYYAAPFPPEGLRMDCLYSIVKIDGDFFVVDGENKVKVDEFMLKTLFTLENDGNWEDVSFEDSKVK